MKLTSNCYAVTGLYDSPPWNINAGFIAGDKITLVIDSGSNTISAQTIYGYAAAVKPGNKIILLNTERHLDHIGGNGYFSDKGAVLYGHSFINRNQTEFDSKIQEINSSISNTFRRNNNEGLIAYQNTRIVNPGQKIDKEFEMDLGGICARILLTPGHTKSNISVYQKDDKVLYCGDCILPGFIPNLEEGNVSDWRSWLDSLKIIESLDVGIIVPGHGNVMRGKDYINNEIERIKGIINKAIRNNKAPTVE